MSEMVDILTQWWATEDGFKVTVWIGEEVIQSRDFSEEATGDTLMSIAREKAREMREEVVKSIEKGSL